jgi:uncharacterized protein YceH (UPF0502 family)
MVTFSAMEARVVGALMEKEMTTPEYYPLSLNALVNACNQKSSREPVMELAEADVRTSLFDLEQAGLVRTLSERVSKFEHRMRDQLNLRRDETAVICLLLLRGAQTPAELRGRAERMHAFDDNAAVAATLARLAAREEPLVVLLARQSGAREARWMHLLSGPVADVAPQHDERPSSTQSSMQSSMQSEANGAIAARVAALEQTVRSLEERLRALEEASSASASEREQ